MATQSIINKTNDMVRSGREFEERRCDYVCVLALVDTTAPKTLVLPVKEAFMPRLPTSEVRVRSLANSGDLLAPTAPDVCVALLGNEADKMGAWISELAASGVHVAMVVESALDAPRLYLGETSAKRVSTISATNEDVLMERLAEWLIGATDKSIAMAANFPFCRRAKVRQLTHDYAIEYAADAAKQGPKGELPSMAVSQASLALSIAAVNGQPLTLGRVPEVLSAVAAGIGSRTFATKALGKIPIVGWLLEAGFGYLGTQATGKTLQRRFDKKELKAQGIEPEHTKLDSARRVATTIQKRISHRPGETVRSSSQAEVRLLPSSTEGGFLMYEQEACE